MKRFRRLLQPHLVRPIAHSAIGKLVLSASLALFWSLYVNTKNRISPLRISDCFFFLAVYFLVWVWLQYLALDGFRPFRAFRQRGAEEGSPAAGFRLKDLVNQRVESYAELDEEEQIAARLCANLIVCVFYLVLYAVLRLL